MIKKSLGSIDLQHEKGVGKINIMHEKGLGKIELKKKLHDEGKLEGLGEL